MADRLGREERFEHLSDYVLGHAGSGIRHRHDDVVALLGFGA
jgi:hypothetical protein